MCGPAATGCACAGAPDRGGGAASRRVGVAARAGLLLITLYRLTLSPLIGRECRYLPTCSHYAEEAITRHGLWAGGFMTLARLMRCHPFGASGYDPVPEAPPAAGRWWRPWRYGRWTGAHIDPATRLDR
jgi:putative membrane protein insertion efficiency factor